MSKIYLIGDLHGSFKSIREFSKLLTLTTDDVFICLGDFGGQFFFDYRDENFKKDVTRYNASFFVIRGNHEERPSNCMKEHPDEWHIEQFWGNDVYVENKFPTIKYALDMPAEYNIPTAEGIIRT